MTTASDLEAAARLLRVTCLWHDLLRAKPFEKLRPYLNGPEFALRLLSDELALARLTNEELRGYLSRQLGNYPSFRNRASTELRVLLGQIIKEVGKGRNAYLAALVSQANVLCEQGDFVTSLTQYIHDFVNGVELGTHLYSVLQQLLTAIDIRGSRSRSASANLFSEIFYSEGFVRDGHYYHQYPLEAFAEGDRARLIELQENMSLYEASLRAQCELLTVDTRFEGLARAIVSLDRTSRTYIFPVFGVKGIEPFTIGDVHFYAPHQNPRLLSGHPLDQELFGRQQRDAINAAVTIAGTFNEASRGALQAIETALDLLAFYTPYEHIEVRSNRMLVVDQDGNWRGSSGSNSFSDEHVHDYRALESDRLQATLTFPYIERSGTRIALQSDAPNARKSLVTSLRAFRKAEASTIPEDQLINYWIAAEALLKTDHRTGYFKQEASSENAEQLALRIVPALATLQATSSVATDLLAYLRHAIDAEQSVEEYRYALSGVSEELRVESRVVGGPWTAFLLNDFIERLPDWRDAVQANTLVLDRVEFGANFYGSNVAAKAALEAHKDCVKDEVIIVYQLRNRIVHNAYFDSVGLGYFIEKARRHAELLIKAVLAHPGLDAFEALSAQCALADRLLIMLNEVEHVDLNNYGSTFLLGG